MASILCKILEASPYGYTEHIAEEVSKGMIYEGDQLFCNCDQYDDSDHPLNLFAKFCAHQNDLAVMTIHPSFNADSHLHKDDLYKFMENASRANRSIAFVIEHGVLQSDMIEILVRKLASLLWLFESIKSVYVLHESKEMENEKVCLLSPLDQEWVRVEASTAEQIFDYESWRF